MRILIETSDARGVTRTFVPIDFQPVSHDFRRFYDEFLINIASEPVPSVPPHLWGSSKSVIVSNRYPGNQEQQE